MKSQAINWEKTFASHIANKGLISRTYKEPQNSTIKYWERLEQFTEDTDGKYAHDKTFNTLRH